VPSSSPSFSPVVAAAAADPATRAKANAELLHEMFYVVFQREPRDRSEFGSYVDTLNQGASLEGVYNGFTHSSIYRKLEVAHAGASVEALRIFGEELEELEAVLPVRTHFDEKSAQPLAAPVMPTGIDADDDAVPEGKELVFGKTADERTGPAARYASTFVGSSVFTLKRVLGDEAMKALAALKEDRAKEAAWYARWVVRLCARNVDFGLALRNKPDEPLHLKWVATVSDDQLLWEVLNRLHRLLNEANRQKQ